MREKRESMGREAYEIRKKYGYSWAIISKRMRSTQSNVRKAAELWAEENQQDWPLEMYSKGRMIYEMLGEGWTLLEIRKEIHMETYTARKYARDWAKRNSRQWPVTPPSSAAESVRHGLP